MINSFFSSRLVSIVMVLIAYIYLLVMPGREVDAHLTLSNFLIISISAFFCFTEQSKPFSLFKMVMLFFLLFFGLAAMFEYKLGLQYWGGGQIDVDDYLVANIAIILALLIYLASYNYLFFKFSTVRPWLSTLFEINPITNKQPNLNFIFLLMGCISCIAVWTFYGFDFNTLLLRGGDFNAKTMSDAKFAGLIADNFFRPLAFNSFAAYLLLRKKIDIFMILLLALALLAASPTVLPRFLTATLYLSVIWIYLWRTKKEGFYLNNVILVGFIFAFPFLDLFRSFTGFGDLEFSINLDFFSEGHFDAYQQLVRTISLDLVTLGSQLFGAILFFIPRDIWPDKAWGSGQFLGENLGFSFTNISMPLFGEGYINFGWFGMFTFVLLLAAVTAKIDKYFWSLKSLSSPSSLFPLAYAQMIGLVFFIMRGDLQSSVAYTCGVMSSIVLIAFFLRLSYPQLKLDSFKS